jgi:hypothetical protein
MLRRSGAWRLLVGLVGISTCGCATQTVNTNMHNMMCYLTGQPVDETATKDDEEGWNDVGKDMRADQTPTTDNDPMRNIFVSPRAQEIERSLGVQ